MKLLTIFIFMGTLALSASSYSQVTKIDLQISDPASLKDVFRSIENVSEFIFFYDDDIIKNDIRRTVSAKGETIETILNQLFQGTDVAYLIDDRQIFLYQKDDLKTLDLLKTEIQSQQNTVSGTVKDASSGEPLPGVTVLVKGTSTGTISDASGKFSVNFQGREAILVFSFTGFTTQEMIATPGAVLNVSLPVEVTEISEVMVVGYSTQKKESVVGAVSQVNSTPLIQSNAPNITGAIAGKLSGVLTMQQSGQPGNNQAEIVIRGLSSWQGSAPLVMIDGVERDFQDMDPNEINTISVLKDASATAVFGSKGANGVILVTTKRGLLGKPKMTFTGSTGLETATTPWPLIDSYTTLTMFNSAKMNAQKFDLLTSEKDLQEYRNPSSALKAVQYPTNDWFKLCTKPALSRNANLTVTGGTDFVKYFLLLGYRYEGSFFKQADEGYRDIRYWYNRFNYRTNLDFTLTRTTQLSLNVGGEIGIKNSPNEDSSGDWKSFYCASVSEYPAYFPAWVLEEIPDTDYPDETGIRRAATPTTWITNPWSNINRGSFSRYLDSKLYTDLILDQKLDNILKGLSVKGKVAINTYYNHLALTNNYNYPSYRLIWSRVGVDANNDGKVDQNPWERDGQGAEYYYPAPIDINVGTLSSGYYTNLYYEASLNYSQSFGNHHVTGLALINFQEKDLGTEFPYYNEAVVGRTTYDYSHKYLVELNVGYTGSERFAPGNRFGFFPSAAVGWVISEESFFKDAISWMSKLKIRYSDGLVGSDLASSRWLYMSDYSKDYYGYINESAGPNVSAGWEEARKRDLGFEFGMLKNQLTFSVDLFDEQRSKMLLTPRSVTFLIGNTFKDLNLGRLKKHGIEIEAEYNKTTVSNLNYFIRGNFGWNENRIIFKDDPIYAPDYTKDAGKPLGAQLLCATRTGTGYYTTVDEIQNSPTPIALEKLFIGQYRFLDFNADGKLNMSDNHPVKGQTYAPAIYSLSSGFKYKGFEFRLMFQGNYGKYITLGAVSEVEFYTGIARVHSTQLDYWRPDHQDATHSALIAGGADDAMYTWAGYRIYQDLTWRDASYTRLKEVYFGYNLKPGFLKRIAGISDIVVYANGTNLLTFTKLNKEFDPEVAKPGYGLYPQLSYYNIGVRFAF